LHFIKNTFCFFEKKRYLCNNKITCKDNTAMATAVKKTKARPKAAKEIDARHKIKPRGLCGMFKGRIILNGTDEEVFSLNRLADVK